MSHTTWRKNQNACHVTRPFGSHPNLWQTLDKGVGRAAISFLIVLQHVSLILIWHLSAWFLLVSDKIKISFHLFLHTLWASNTQFMFPKSSWKVSPIQSSKGAPTRFHAVNPATRQRYIHLNLWWEFYIKPISLVRLLLYQNMHLYFQKSIHTQNTQFVLENMKHLAFAS